MHATAKLDFSPDLAAISHLFAPKTKIHDSNRSLSAQLSNNSSGLRAISLLYLTSFNSPLSFALTCPLKASGWVFYICSCSAVPVSSFVSIQARDSWGSLKWKRYVLFFIISCRGLVVVYINTKLYLRFSVTISVEYILQAWGQHEIAMLNFNLFTFPSRQFFCRWVLPNTAF